MVRSEYKYQYIRVWVFDFGQQDGNWEGRGNRRAYRCSSPAKRPSLDEQWAAKFALSSPLGKEDRGRENREVVGMDGATAAAPAGLELQLGKGVWRVAHGPAAWRAARAGGAKGGDGVAGRRKGDVAGEDVAKGAAPAARKSVRGERQREIFC
jgi:hypothetical protein